MVRLTCGNGWPFLSQPRIFMRYVLMSNQAEADTQTPVFRRSMPGVRIGHVHLKVADLERALDFYCGVLGFEVTTSRPGAAFISAGGYHHHLALNTWESKGGAAARARHHRPLSHRDPLPDPQAAGRCAQAPDRGAHPARRRERPRRVARRSICATRTTTASSFTGTGRRSTGRRSRTARCRCSPIRSTCTTCWRSWSALGGSRPPLQHQRQHDRQGRDDEHEHESAL